MEWITIIGSLIGGFGIGELINLFTIRQQKKGLEIDNKQKELEMEAKIDERWQQIVTEMKDENRLLREQNTELNSRVDAKDALLIEKSDTISNLRVQLDARNTEVAKLTLLRCNRLNCELRQPPFGYTELSAEELIDRTAEQ